MEKVDSNNKSLTQQECIRLLKNDLPHIQNEYGVTGLTLIGSVARGDNRPDSDIDILVDMPPKIIKISELKYYLESLLHKSVDLIRRHNHISANFLSQISKDAITLL